MTLKYCARLRHAQSRLLAKPLGLSSLCRASVAVSMTLCVGLAVAATLLPHHAVAQDISLLGGALSNDLQDQNAIQAPAPNITEPSRRQQQAEGFIVFHHVNTAEEGLGPRFINRSCGGCHINNGKGEPSFSRSSNPGSMAVVKVKRAGLNPDGSAPEVPGLGSQITEHDLNNDRTRRVTISWKNVTGRYPDGAMYQLRRPVLNYSKSIVARRRFDSSLRIAPAMVGLGLLEAVPASSIVAMSDATDRNKDGISGRVNFVKLNEKNEYAVGRFGFKATAATVREQSALALYHDMGIENPIVNDNAVELSENQLAILTLYQELGGVPKARNQDQPDVIAGKALFTRIGCDACHRMTLTTGAHQNPELENQVIHPFTDLLLHDMGAGLADKWNEFSARGSEWRTTPLWGLGFAERLSERPIRYLHDGRARSVEEAILWHGGEAAGSASRFKALSKTERDQLISFLRSL